MSSLPSSTGDNHSCIIAIQDVPVICLCEEKSSVHLPDGNGTDVHFTRIPNVFYHKIWVFRSPHAYMVSIHLPMKVKRSFVAANKLFSVTVSLQVMQHFGTELQTVGSVVTD